MPPILIDTNVLIYLYDPNQPDKQKQAERVLEQLELTRTGRLSVQALAEFFSVATRKLSPSLTSAEALDQVTLFTRLKRPEGRWFKCVNDGTLVLKQLDIGSSFLRKRQMDSDPEIPNKKGSHWAPFFVQVFNFHGLFGF